MGRIFLSYAREDRACAERLARVLEAEAHSVWWDRHLDGGEEFADEIEAELDAADAVVVAWSTQSIKSRWVRDEAAVGGESDRLVPVTIDGSLPPMGFRQFHTLDLTGWKGAKRDSRTADLIHSIERRVAGKTPAPGAERKAIDRTPALGRTTARWVAAALAVVIAAIGLYVMFGRWRGADAALTPTIALLPITAASNDSAQRELASQIRDSLAHRLSQSDLLIRPIESAPNDTVAAGDYLLSGEVSRNGDKLVATIRLDETAHGVTVFSKRFEATGAESADFVDRVGVQIAGNLTWAAPLMALEKRHPSDPAVVADLIRQLDFTNGGLGLQGYQTARRAAARAPESAFAHVSLAMNTGTNLTEIPGPERIQAVASARQAAERAIKLAPEFGDVRGAWCYLHSETLRTECEDRLRAAKRIDPEAPFVDFFLSALLRSVGRFDEAVELARLSYAHDPYVPTKISLMIRMLEFAGETEQAEDLSRDGERWWPEFAGIFVRQRVMGLLNRGDLKAIHRIERQIDAQGLPPLYTDGTAQLLSAIASKSISSARRVCMSGGDAPYWLDIRCLIAASQLGDLDGAFAIADRRYPKRVGRTAAETERIWLEDPESAPVELIASPATAAMRRDPRYLALAERMGLLAYWRTGRLPDFCREKPEPICAHLRRR